MKQHDITKICADSLRSFVNDNHGVKLGSSHAHELVAAYFGYKSRAAMLADTKYPMSALGQAKIIVMAPDTFIDQRRKELENLPHGLPDSYALGEGVYRALFSSHEQWSSAFPPFRSFLSLAKFMQEERGLIDGSNIYALPRHHVFDEQPKEDEMVLTIKHAFESGAGKMNVDTVTTIRFSRIAGRIGYGLARISEERGKEVIVPKAHGKPKWPYPNGTLVQCKDTKEIGIVFDAGENSTNALRLYTDTSKNMLIAKHEVSLLVDQSIEFVPMRLFLPYGKYVCDDGSEVLFNRDYNPLWSRKPDGSVAAIDPDTFIKHDRSKTQHYFNQKNGPAWGDKNMREIGMSVLKEWGVENKRPRTLDLLPQAIKAGDIDVLGQMSGGDRTKVFP